MERWQAILLINKALDDKMEEWRTNVLYADTSKEQAQPLSQYLRMSPEEYAVWVRTPIRVPERLIEKTLKNGSFEIED